MEHERRHSETTGVDSPVHSSKALTDASYHHCLGHLMELVQNHNMWIMVATHNEETVCRAIELMEEHEIPMDDGRVSFGQLLGMGDRLTIPLASAGYNVGKVVPYGSLDDILPFLVRRGLENRGMVRNAGKERKIYSQEMKRRLYKMKWR